MLSIHFRGHHHCVDVAFREQCVEPLGCRRFVQWIAEDGIEACGTGDGHKTRICRPPSTCTVSPVEKGRAPLASIATTRPTSSGSPHRFIGAMPSAII